MLLEIYFKAKGDLRHTGILDYVIVLTYDCGRSCSLRSKIITIIFSLHKPNLNTLNTPNPNPNPKPNPNPNPNSQP